MEQHIYEGTAQELAPLLAKNPDWRLRVTRLPQETEANAEALDAKLRQWQEQDNTALVPDVPAQTLFAQWAQEDAGMTDAEREAEDRLWQDIEQDLLKTMACG